jgi:hypothetical protein
MSHARMKRADTTSSIGAGVLGAGLALLVPERLKPFALPILLVGLATHVWGMYDRHRLERQAGEARLWWAELLYWGCWALLAALVLFIVARER